MRERGRFFCVCEVKPRKFGNLSLISTMDLESNLVAFTPSHLPVSETCRNFIKGSFFFLKMLGFAYKSVDWRGKRKVDIFCLAFLLVESASRKRVTRLFFFSEGFGWSEISSVAIVRDFYQLSLLMGLKLGVYILSLAKKASLRASMSPANILWK